MNAHLTCYTVATVDAERILAQQLASLDGRSVTIRTLHCRTLQCFLADLSEPGDSGTLHLVLTEGRLIEWMIRDVANRKPLLAGKRLSVVGRYLQTLARADLVGADLMMEFRARHGYRPWRVIVKALQAEDPKAALADLHPDPLSAGPLAVQIRTFLELQRSLGKKYRSQDLVLNQFSRFLQMHGVQSPQAVKPAVVQLWLDNLTCSSATRASYMRLTERFFYYLQQLEIVVDNPLAPFVLGMTRSSSRSFQPFIFTHDQVAAILAKARHLPCHPWFPLHRPTCYTMLVLLYTLGLRHGEARRLCVRDVDWERQTLFISQTKFHKSRYVPFGPKVGCCVRQFLEARRTVLSPLREDDPLFVTLWRKPFGSNVLLGVFRELGVSKADGQRSPRLHDLRHTFAVHRLLRWYREGGDIQGRLPALATFMGHIEPLSTQIYLTITAELLNEANARFHRNFGCRFDEGVQP